LIIPQNPKPSTFKIVAFGERSAAFSVISFNNSRDSAFFSGGSCSSEAPVIMSFNFSMASAISSLPALRTFIIPVTCPH